MNIKITLELSNITNLEDQDQPLRLHKKATQNGVPSMSASTNDQPVCSTEPPVASPSPQHPTTFAEYLQRDLQHSAVGTTAPENHKRTASAASAKIDFRDKDLLQLLLHVASHGSSHQRALFAQIQKLTQLQSTPQDYLSQLSGILDISSKAATFE